MEVPETILLVDDEVSILQSLSGILEDEGYEVLTAQTGENALRLLDEANIDLFILDIWLPRMDGIELLGRIRMKNALIPVVMISGHGSIETAVKATRLGAFDYLEKPLSLEKVLVTVNNALRYGRLSKENQLLKSKSAQVHQINGNSIAIQKLTEQIRIVAPTQASVLITGENGTGKELVAHSIHRLSDRASRPLIEVNCAAIPEELIESELFGHEKGAFTGATERKKGKFDLANEGTLLLDEIGDMSLKTQSKILRILQERRFERVGGSKTIMVDVRVLAATNKDLEKEIREGRFREDLYYRLNVIPIHVPPLRDRPEDIQLLAEEFLHEYAISSGSRPKRLTSKGIDLLTHYQWPGNVRELKNLMERVAILSPDEVISDDLIERFIRRGDSYLPGKTSLDAPTLKEARQDFERAYIAKRLAEHGGNVSQTAAAIGLERSHLHKKMKALGLTETS